MQRLKLFLGILALALVTAWTVVFCSPYAPVVEPVMEIEEIWAIEDARTQSAAPLVTALENHGVPLAYDKNENTFYCTLGLENGESWPELHITAPGTKGVSLVFVDDYSYDWCADAIAEGYPYQVMTYTDTAFYYTQIVFTGLPLVSIRCEEEITAEDTFAQIAWSAFGSEAVRSACSLHLRGGASLNAEKSSYKVNFTRSAEGKRNTVHLPGFGFREDLILGAMHADERMIRDRLNWEIYGEMLGEDYDGGFGARKTGYAELFVNDEYRGVYLTMEPMDAEAEVRREGDAHVMTDSVYRTLHYRFADDKPVLQNPAEEKSLFELHYEPAGVRQFAAMEPYLALLREEDDEAFAQKAAACMDMESVVRYIILWQAAGMTDNVYNNLYFWARQEKTGMRYVLAPWDMDLSWGTDQGKLGVLGDRWLAFPPFDRIVALNAGGAAQMLAASWRSWRETIFTQEHIEALVSRYMHELEGSGALARNMARWQIAGDDRAGYEIVEFAVMRFDALDLAMDIIEESDGGVPPFLSCISHEADSYLIGGNGRE